MEENLMKKAWIVQDKIEARMNHVRLSLRFSLKDMFLLIGFCMFITGIGMFFLCSVSGISESDMVWNCSPTFWMVTGGMFLFCYVTERRYGLWRL